MSLRQQLKYFPLIVGVIALVLGVHISISMGQRPGHSQRRPSAIVTMDKQRFGQFDIGCAQKIVSFQSTSDQVRIKGCLGSLGAPVKIVNLSTSLELTVLENDEIFTTDYFKLAPSKNLLKISYKDNSEVSIPITYKPEITSQ